MQKIDIASIPELSTSVGIHGSSKQKEVGGPFCLAIVVGLAMFALAGTEKKPPTQN